MSGLRSILMCSLPCLLLAACGGDDGGPTPPASGNPPVPVETPSPSPSPDPTPSPNPNPTEVPDWERTSFDEEASNLDVASLLNTRRIPISGAPDTVGAFRFLCGPGQLIWDDPIVYPGQKGKSHLHQFFGNLEANADSTYASLRKSGDSTCTNELNRSAYWIPALLDGKGNAIRPNHVAVYYKRRPASDPWFQTARNEARQLPRGLRYVFGWDHMRAGETQPENTSHFQWKCVDGSTLVGAGTMDQALVGCTPGQAVIVSISSPKCWDGRNLDSFDHRSHMSDMIRGVETGWTSRCPDTHPFVVPTFTLNVKYTIGPEDDTALWKLSSDGMLPAGAPRGSSMHADWLGAWEDEILTAWHEGCINKLLNCSDGDLGDGRGMTRGIYYPKGIANPRLVPIPDRGDTWMPPRPDA